MYYARSTFETFVHNIHNESETNLDHDDDISFWLDSQWNCFEIDATINNILTKVSFSHNDFIPEFISWKVEWL